MAPQVSVIIPVYNSVNYVRDALRSVQEQTLDPDALEVLVVDDGSTDGTDAILAEIAAKDERIDVTWQENSGTPGGARNPAIGRATGDFIFFLDSDDELTPDALRRLVETAEREGSDVVLGKMASMDGRHAPASMFKRTVMDADLLDENVFNTLGPTKLIRRSVIEGLNLRFPEDQGVGEDQPFMAAVYLNARKISVLSDQDYYLIRHRTDGSNMTLTKRRPSEHLLTAVRLAQVIEEYTEPGPRRDALLRRPFAWTMKRVLDGRWARMERAEQESLGSYFRSGIGHLYTEGVRARLAEELRWKLDLLNANDLDGLDECVKYFAKAPERRMVWSEGAFRRQLPGELERVIPVGNRQTTPPKMAVKLEDLRVEGKGVRVTVSATMPELDGGPDSLSIRGRLRHADGVEDFRVITDDLRPEAPTFLVTAEHCGLVRGVWDLYAVVRFGEYEKELRIGATRARSVQPEGVGNLSDDPLPEDRLIAYFTQGAGNLSIDRGGLIQRNISGVRSLGVTADENGRALMLVETTGTPKAGDEYFCYLSGVKQHGGRQLLPTVRLGDRLLGLRLPVSAQMIGATVTVASVVNGIRTPLRVTGTEYWPSRAAGFALAADGDGGMKVAEPPAGALARAKTAVGKVGSIPRASTEERNARARVVAATKTLPVVGPVLTRAARKVRGWRA